MNIESDRIDEVSFEGRGCAISTASASLDDRDPDRADIGRG